MAHHRLKPNRFLEWHHPTTITPPARGAIILRTPKKPLVACGRQFNCQFFETATLNPGHEPKKVGNNFPYLQAKRRQIMNRQAISLHHNTDDRMMIILSAGTQRGQR